LTIQANIAARIAGLVPSVTAAALVAMNGLLPNSGGIRTRATGAESESDWSPSLLTIANERAAHRYNEI